MRLIGMTGRSGAGKTTVGVCAKEMGIPVLDCDAIYRELTSGPSDCLRAIQKTFGEETVRFGALYRPALREKVFADREAMKQLHSITALFMARELRSRLEHIDASMVILDAPTLFESGLDAICHRLLCVISTDEFCLRRIIRRDRIGEADARARLAQQHSNAFLIEHCDIVLFNEGTEESFRTEAFTVLSALQKGGI